MPKHKRTLSHERLLEVLDYNPATGDFTWLVDVGDCPLAGSKTGQASDSGGYLHVGIDGGCYRNQRLAWFYVNGEWPETHVDHINGNKLDNRIANLRIATRSQNCMNSKRRIDGKSKYRGVSIHKQSGRWSVKFRGRYIGLCHSEEEGHQLYLAEMAKFEAAFPLPRHPSHEGLVA